VDVVREVLAHSVHFGVRASRQRFGRGCRNSGKRVVSGDRRWQLLPVRSRGVRTVDDDTQESSRRDCGPITGSRFPRPEQALRGCRHRDFRLAMATQAQTAARAAVPPSEARISRSFRLACWEWRSDGPLLLRSATERDSTDATRCDKPRLPSRRLTTEGANRLESRGFWAASTTSCRCPWEALRGRLGQDWRFLTSLFTAGYGGRCRPLPAPTARRCELSALRRNMSPPAVRRACVLAY
jgi:hypothetical protein